MIEDLSPERWQRISALFDEARELPPERREAFLDEACAGDAELLRRVTELLEAAERSAGLLDQPAMAHAGSLLRHVAQDEPAQPTETVTGSPDEHLTAIGPYRPLQRLGEGGMGEVWLAEQTEPIRRRVALKLIKAGMDTKQFVARFEAERQALALMDHPTIAKVFDAGETPRGLPYFVMEYVKGEPITAYCDRQRLTTRERLELFTEVCEGVQHAHQKGIIHRDLKPSNVLITIQGEKPVPKIIDFGVAKATAQRLTEKTMFTELGVLIGTPEYMSPEQAEMTGLDVDTRTDVYALGVILYELLTGALPFDLKDFRAAGFDEIRRRIREVDPPRPSTRVSTQGDKATESAQRRRTEPAKLVSRLKGDLDWITMKALEKDRTRRYGSPMDLAMDIARHIHDEPVIAGPPSAAYRTGKFVRRHRLGVTAAALVVMALAGFSVTMAVQAGRIAKERNRAERVSEFLVDLFKVSDPSESRGNTITAREILDQGAEKIEKELGKEPLVQAQLLDTMGQVYMSLSLYEKAAPLIDRAPQIRNHLLGANDPLTLDAQSLRARLSERQGHFPEAEKIYREVLEARRRVLGKENPATLQSMSGLASAIKRQGRYKEAEDILSSLLETRRRVLGEDAVDTLWSMQNMAMIYQTQGRYDEAVKLYQEAIEKRRRVQGEDHPDTLQAMADLADLYNDLGHYEEAEKTQQKVLEARRRVLGENHRGTLDSMNALADLYEAQGRHREAEQLLRAALEGFRRVLGPEHPDTLGVMNSLAGAVMEQGRYGEAEALFRKVLEIEERVLGKDHTDRLAVLNNLGFLQQSRGHYEQAEALFRELVETQVRARGRDQYDTFIYQSNLAGTLRSLGRFREAEKLLAEALGIERRTMGEDNPITMKSTCQLARVYSDEGRQGEAERLLQGVLERQRRIQDEDNPSVLATGALLGKVYARLGRFEEAETLLGKTLQAQRRTGGESQPFTLRTLYFLGCSMALHGNRTKALDYLRQAVERGFPDAETMMRDPDLRSLRRDPAFLALVEAARKNSDR